jgi:hypothetical protein
MFHGPRVLLKTLEQTQDQDFFLGEVMLKVKAFSLVYSSKFQRLSYIHHEVLLIPTQSKSAVQSVQFHSIRI